EGALPPAEGSEADHEGRRRRRRSGRGRGDRDRPEGGNEGVDEIGAQGSTEPAEARERPAAAAAGVSAEAGQPSATQASSAERAATEPAGEGAAGPAAGAEGEAPAEGAEREGGRRRGRGRDRFRRERRPDDAGAQPELEGIAGEPAAAEAPVAFAAPVSAEAPLATSAPAASPAAAAPAPAIVVAERFELPMGELQRIAETAGLQWVNSDPEKIAAAQAAIAAEPVPVHVPREPRPPVVVDEGPLILVETRQDLAQVQLPFERQSGAG
ncbi:MAG: ribonuclease E/G, partial [Rubrivivax sp.]